MAFLRQQLAAARAENSALKRAILSMEAGKGLEGDAGLAALLGIGGSMGAGSAGSDVLQVGALPGGYYGARQRGLRVYVACMVPVVGLSPLVAD